MCRFIETIKLENGRFFRSEYHLQRVKCTFETFFPTVEPFNPVDLLSKLDYPKTGLYKCRIEYSSEPELIEFVPYVKRPIESLKIVEANIEATSFKSLNREAYNIAFAQRGDCDDVLLFRNGLITDTSYANVAFYNGNEWLTPAEPALFGTQRAYLLAEGKIREANIKATKISKFSHVRIFNAMIEFGEMELTIEAIGSK